LAIAGVLRDVALARYLFSSSISSAMIDATCSPMRDLWSEEQKFQSWLDVELAACLL
jgi:adenylosuccinate lyase